jgi:hypothetical protein
MTTAAMDGKWPIDPREVHEDAVRLQEEHAAHERRLGNEAGARRADDRADRVRERLRQLEARRSLT